jgi:predicted AAA+ superfamily ATPase
MIPRSLKPLQSRSFFVFGARRTGKSTFVREQFLRSQEEQVLQFDLLDPSLEDELARHPERLQAEALAKRPKWVFIDEVQKVPKLLNIVQKLITQEKMKFILSGSSARKLRRGAGNLLAGRASVYHLFPLVRGEIGQSFDLDTAMKWGTLPEAHTAPSDQEKAAYLRSYALTYLKEEVQTEQLVRNLDPFRHFLEVAAQSNGRPLNFSRIGDQIGVDHKTVKAYFQILEDTWIGHLVHGHSSSLRKSLRSSPKFYFFDVGVKHALARTLGDPLRPGTSAYGDAFEHLVILECLRMNAYSESDFRPSYILTKDGAEVDLVLSRGNQSIFIEVKSADRVNDTSVKKLARMTPESAKAYLLSNDPIASEQHGVSCRHWAQGIEEIFGSA